MADISAPYNEIIRRRIESAGVPQTKGGALAQGLGMVPQEVQGTTLEDLQKNSLNNVFGFPEIGMKEIYQAGLGLGQKVNEGLGMVSRLPTTATEYLTSPSAAAEAIAAEGITDNSIFEATDIPDIMFERKPGESRDDFKNRFLETDPKFEKGKTTITPGTSGRNKGTPARDGASDEARAQDMIIAKRKKQQEEQLLADKNREASLDMPSDPAEQLFSQAMTDYISQAREGAEDNLPEVGDIEAYKKKFAEATGIDISGKPDTSQALMAMGLSMMQNRAGKGFNVGRMLSAVGEAGEKALPALTAAKAEARNNVIAAGKYALEAESSDKTKREAAKKEMSALSQYFVVPKGDGVAGTVSSILQNKGSLETLSKGELQQLMQNPEFAEKFDILPGSSYTSIVAEAMKTPEAKSLYDTKTPRKMELFGEGAGDLFTIETWRALPNSGVENKLVGTGDETYKALQNAARDINLAKEKFVTGMELAEGTNIFRFGVDKLDNLAEVLGVNLREGVTETQKLKFILDKLQAQNAPEILGEAGKTISDADRARVAQIVGDLNAGSTADEITFKLNDLFNSIIIKKERDILDALNTLDRYTGRSVAPDDGPMSEEDVAELAKREKQRLAGT